MILVHLSNGNTIKVAGIYAAFEDQQRSRSDYVTSAVESLLVIKDGPTYSDAVKGSFKTSDVIGFEVVEDEEDPDELA